jgi:hypothetical protein
MVRWRGAETRFLFVIFKRLLTGGALTGPISVSYLRSAGFPGL